MKVNELLQAAYYTFGQSNTNERFNHDFILSLNEALIEFANSRKWGCLRTTDSLTTTEDVQTVALWSDFGTFYDVRGAHRITSPAANADSIVEIKSLDQQYAREYSGDDTGTPQYAWPVDDDLYFSPIPDAAYVIQFIYYKRPAEATLSTNTIGVSTRYHELIKRLTYKRLLENGYSSTQELSINESMTQKLMGQCVRDDIATYGAPVMALYDDSYTMNIG